MFSSLINPGKLKFLGDKGVRCLAPGTEILQGKGGWESWISPGREMPQGRGVQGFAVSREVPQGMGPGGLSLAGGWEHVSLTPSSPDSPGIPGD